MAAHNPHRRVRIFLSVDLVGSTSFKNQSRKAIDATKYESGPPWSSAFKDFYSGFPVCLERIAEKQVRNIHARPKLVKAIGDELLIEAQIWNHVDAQELFCSFAAAIVEWETGNLQDLPLLLKGTAWIAGFPINNFEVMLPGGIGPDYIGPSIDAGFRLSKFSTPAKFVVSVDLALLLLEGQRTPDLYFERTEPLKGVLGDRPYPLIWHHLEHSPKNMLKHELELQGTKVADKVRLRDYCRAFIGSFQDTWLIEPYFDPNDDDTFKTPPPWHQKIIEHCDLEDNKILVGQERDRIELTANISG